MRDNNQEHDDCCSPSGCSREKPKRAPIRKLAVPGRNAPCWCGSKRKYKTCCWKSDRASR